MGGVLSNKIVDELKPGDHIYSWRHSYLYAHHGPYFRIYVGNGKVIHFTSGNGQESGSGTVSGRKFSSSSPSNPSGSPCPICGDQSKSDGVISSCLECFLSGGQLYQFQYGVSPDVFRAARGGTCTVTISDPPEDVLYRAEYLLKNGFGGYNLFKNNCEDFAIYCKTGLLAFSPVGVGLSGQATSSVAAILGNSPIYRVVSDIGIRPDVKKVPVERLPNWQKRHPKKNSDIEYEPWGQII